jgi:MoaA/NifB/PqqE/SkfB family radical SAM enzyme
MTQLLGQVPRYWTARWLGTDPPLPLNLTIGLTYRCNSRCMTCRAYERRSVELSAAEWQRVFRSLGTSPYWLTFSGGEPFLRRDTAQVVSSAIAACRPAVVNIPTNGLLTERVVSGVDAICVAHPGTQIIVNVSLDALGDQHDEIRGVPGAFTKAVATVKGLQSLGHSNLTVGIHTVISRFNAAQMDCIATGLLELEPDSYVTEVAEQRVELGTTELDITPDADSYGQAVSHVEAAVSRHSGGGVSAVVQAFRRRYYEMARYYLQSGKMAIPCYAGLASAQIAPDGDVWFCCIRAQSVGNLREADYDFRRIWHSEVARELRESVKRRECACPLANAAYTNMLCHPPTMARVLWQRLVAAGRSAASFATRRPTGTREDRWGRPVKAFPNARR